MICHNIITNEEDYVHPALFGAQSCRKAIQLMRAKHFLNAVQRAGEHRRVLAVVLSLFVLGDYYFNLIINVLIII